MDLGTELHGRDVHGHGIRDLAGKHFHGNFTEEVVDNAAELHSGAGVAADKFHGNVHRNLVALHELQEVDVKNSAGDGVFLDLSHEPHLLLAAGEGEKHGLSLPVAGSGNLGNIRYLHLGRHGLAVLGTIHDTGNIPRGAQLAAGFLAFSFTRFKNDFHNFRHNRHILLKIRSPPQKQEN